MNTIIRWNSKFKKAEIKNSEIVFRTTLLFYNITLVTTKETWIWQIKKGTKRLK